MIFLPSVDKSSYTHKSGHQKVTFKKDYRWLNLSLCFDFLWSIACIIEIVHHDNVSVGIYRADQLFKILTRPYWKGHGCVILLKLKIHLKFFKWEWKLQNFVNFSWKDDHQKCYLYWKGKNSLPKKSFDSECLDYICHTTFICVMLKAQWTWVSGLITLYNWLRGIFHLIFQK